jgi:hypothetical protein
MPKKNNELSNAPPSLLERVLASKPDGRKTPEPEHRAPERIAPRNDESKRKAKWRQFRKRQRALEEREELVRARKREAWRKRKAGLPEAYKRIVGLMERGRWYLWRDLMRLIGATKTNVLGGPLRAARKYGLIESEDLPTKGEFEPRLMPGGSVLMVIKPGMQFRLTKLGEACQQQWRQEYGLSCWASRWESCTLTQATVG